MIRIEKLILIGATGRNSGKTELVTMLIEKFSPEYKIIGLKVSTYYGNDEQFHGQNQIHLKEKFIIEKDANNSAGKNTSKMLVAGAKEVYWIKSKIECLNNAIHELILQLDKNIFIVCESNSLRKVVIPDVFIMIKNNMSPVKNSASDVINMADTIIESNGKEFTNFNISEIGIKNGKWKFNPKGFTY